MSVASLLNTLNYRQRVPNSLGVRIVARMGLRLVSGVGAWLHREAFQSVNYFCLFVGYPRSGHSLIGALLDAHPRMVIAHEFDTLQYLASTQNLPIQNRELDLYYLLLERSRWFKQQNAEWTGYSYAVPSQYKGEYKTLRVIGDKKGGGTSVTLWRTPELLTALKQLLSVPIKVIHVSRHPLDNISTITQKDKDGNIEEAIALYFRRCEGILHAWKHTSDEHWLTIPLESFIEQPRNHLAEACDFFGVGYTEAYLQDCSEIVFDTPNRTRDEIQFTSNHIKKIQRRAKDMPFLNRYDIIQ